jgi:hypothetical protein
MSDNCNQCGRFDGTLHWNNGWVCKDCYQIPSPMNCRLFEFGHENPQDPQGSTAHVRDIKDRRWHPQEKRSFYYSRELGKTYFFPK